MRSVVSWLLRISLALLPRFLVLFLRL
jgi:hypothetical protein